MRILSDSFSVLIGHWWLIAGILLIILSSQMLVWSGLKTIFGGRLTSGEYYSLSIAGWILPIVLATALWHSWKLFQRLDVGALIIILLVPIFAVIPFLRA